ncbi:fatty acid synthase-like [Oppia nitens]|uniref:fatty acid synthase-like n=1 Tax=Oppia nitens TaxID=1686743 RepID=UPI0023DCE3E1|nr:fatty acid synthase-like [Oppia nitens]
MNINNDIVISGMSGRFPLSDNIDEFADNLYNGIDMVTDADDGDCRWPKDLYGINSRQGKVRDFDRFDVFFFGITEQLMEIDPQSRKLLETTYEAIVDAGINPSSLSGTKTGVYIGVSTYAMTDSYPEEIQPDIMASRQSTMLQIVGNSKSMYANRISYVFNFKGPSLMTDTACSASIVAFNLAINDLKLGNVDYAVVGGTHMTFEPFIVQMSQEISVCSPRGLSSVLDQEADGFVKGDAIACLFLQRRPEARRIYASVLASRVNVDGKKTKGMFFPSTEAQQDLMIMTYKEANVDPLKVNYFEAHCTGTRVGDPQEVKAIYNAYCSTPNRIGYLPLGLLKSSTGHTEAASGVSAIIKTCLVFENELIPANINLKTIKNECKHYCPPLYPNTEPLAYEPAIAGINNFGIGGANGHVLIECNYKLADDKGLDIAEPIPRIVNICGRTEAAIQHVFEFIEKNPHKITRDFLALLTDTMKVSPSVNSSGFPYRGSIILKKLSDDNNNNKNIRYEYKKQFSLFKCKSLRPVWLLFPGLGGQWPAMAKALMPIDIFKNKVEECHKILLEFNVNLKHWLLSEDNTSISTMTAKFCTTTAIELALFDVIKALDINVDGIIGHSFGEIACAYADGCLTTKEAIIVSYIRGAVTENDKKIPKGLMAVVGLSKNEAKKLCTQGVYVVCNNAKDTVVVSGKQQEMEELIEKIRSMGVFVRQLDSSGIPYHSPYMESSVKPMIETTRKYILKPRLRSSRWLSTSVVNLEQQDNDNNDILKYASSEYFAYNVLNSVHFYDRLKTLPTDSIVIEMGPHTVFGKIVTETLESSTYLSFMKKDSNDTNLDLFLSCLAKLYELGLNPSIDKLYPPVEWPVARNTQSIGSLIRWDHSHQYICRKYPEFYTRSTASDMNVAVNIQMPEDCYYADHAIDGNILFPATGYIMLVWRHFASYCGKIWNKTAVQFENIQFKRSVFLSDTSPTRLKVRYFQNSHDFVILENDNVCCSGKVSRLTDDGLYAQNLIYENDENRELTDEYSLSRDDIYKELRIVGYDYGPAFRRLKRVRTNNFVEILGSCEWNGLFVPFLDSVLQSTAFVLPFRKLMVPVMIKSLKIDPKLFFEAIVKNRLTVDDDDQVVNKIADKDCQEVAKWKCRPKELDVNEQTAYTDLYEQTDEILKQISERFHKYKSLVSFYFDYDTKLLVTYGIEICDLIVFPITRRSDNQDLVLDSYEFVANEDMDAIEPSLKHTISEYLEVCKMLIVLIKKIEKYRKSLNNENFVIKIVGKIWSEIKSEPEYDFAKDITNEIHTNDLLLRSLVDIVNENLVPQKSINVVEINLTHGLLAKEIEKLMSNYHFYPIDVNYKLIVRSMDVLLNDLSLQDRYAASVWQTRDSDFPTDISIADFIVARDSQHIYDDNNIDVDKFIINLSDYIVSNGFLLTIHRYRFTDTELMLNNIVNNDTVKSGKLLDNTFLEQRIDQFITAANRAGLRLIGRKYDTIGTMALLYRKTASELVNGNPDLSKVIMVDSLDYDNWLPKLQENKSSSDTVWLMAIDSYRNGIISLINSLRLEPGGNCFKCIIDYNITTDNNDINCLDFYQKYKHILANGLAVNVINKYDGKHQPKVGTYRHLKLNKDYDKIRSNDYFLSIGQGRDLSSLQWFDSRCLVPSDEGVYDFLNNRIKQIPINIYSSGLTFRDVMFATGRLTISELELITDCLIGYEFVGRRIDTGERVMGMSITRCFATSVQANSKFITSIPTHWSMDDAVTILTTYITVWYGLIYRADLMKNESILIHSGAGGVGQAAINICQYYNCDIFVTVGTEDKKQFLIKEYNIPENRIFSSRDILFKLRIKQLTKGKGVDLVLNSLTGEKLDASYECLANRGRFVELGKYDQMQNKQIGMFDFLRDISFIGVAFDMCLFEAQDFAINFFEWMHKNSSNGCIKPINRTVFGVNEAEKAFRYMTTGKHIGKIIIKIRDEESDRNAVKDMNPSIGLLVTTKTYFNPNKVYIITGGLGGCGLELVHWMLYKGAKKFVLNSRNGIKNDYQKYILKRLETFGKKYKMFSSEIIVSTANCLTIDGTKQLLGESQQLGKTIGGVFHLTLLLNDLLLENQTTDTFGSTVASKYAIFANLDQMTRKLDIKLDYFVVFSSLIAGKGNGGQSNYAFGNSMCERLCEQRSGDGLKALAIQFGPIGDVGALSNKDQVVQMSNMKKQRINSVFEVMDRLLAVDKLIVTSYLISERIMQSESRQKRVIKKLWRALGVHPDNTPDYLSLGELGLESMFAVELQQELEREYNIKISLNNIRNITVQHIKLYDSGRVDDVSRYVQEFEMAKTNLLNLKFIIPTDRTVKLNNITAGRPIYLLPTVDGSFKQFEALAKRFRRPVVGINWTRDLDGIESVNDMTKYFIDLLNTIHNNNNNNDLLYDIVGYFDCAFIATKIVRKTRGVKRAVIIDILSETQFNEDAVTDEFLMEFIIGFISTNIPKSIKYKIYRDMKSEPTIDARVQRACNEIREFAGHGLVATDLEEILRNSLKRAKLLTDYRSQKMKKLMTQTKSKNLMDKWSKSRQKLTIIKPLFKEFNNIDDEEVFVNKTNQLYFLPTNPETNNLTFNLIKVDEHYISIASEKIEVLPNYRSPEGSTSQPTCSQQSNTCAPIPIPQVIAI